MDIRATAPGRKGGLINDGVARLILKSEQGQECHKLKILFDEFMDGNFSFWSPLMWAARTKRLTKAEIVMLEKAVDRVSEEFVKHVSR